MNQELCEAYIMSHFIQHYLIDLFRVGPKNGKARNGIDSKITKHTTIAKTSVRRIGKYIERFICDITHYNCGIE
jgi:hypothetical protein